MVDEQKILGRLVSKFHVKDALASDTQGICDRFNASVNRGLKDDGTIYHMYPRAELGTGFSGDRTILVRELTNHPDDSDGTFDYAQVEGMITGIAQDAGFDCEKR